MVNWVEWVVIGLCGVSEGGREEAIGRRAVKEGREAQPPPAVNVFAEAEPALRLEWKAE